jgi:PEP-CTERM motif.
MRIQRRQSTLSALALGALLIIGAPAAHAAIDLYTGNDLGAGASDPRPNSDAAAAAFDAAVAALTGTAPGVVTFENVAIGSLTGNTSATVGAGITATVLNNGGDGVRLTSGGSGSTGYNVTPGGNQFLDLRGSSGANPYGVSFAFADPVQAFGFYLVGLSDTPASPLTVSFVAEGTSQSFTLTGVNNNGVQFFGFTAGGESITEIRIERAAGSGDFIGLDDVRFGYRFQAAAVPEPGTFALAAPGLLALVGVGMRARRRRA